MTHRVDPRNRRRPTYARREQLIEAIDGIAYCDPYRWLEDDSPEAIAWQDAENQRAREFLEQTPGFEPLRASITRYTEPLGVATPRYAGGWWFRTPSAKTGLCYSQHERRRAWLNCACNPDSASTMIVKTPVFPGSSHRPTVVTSLMELPTAAVCKAASSCCDFAYLMWRQGVICRRELPTSRPA